MALTPPPLAPIDGGGKTVDPTSWKAAAKDSGNYSGLGIPNASNLTGEQALISIEQMALKDPAQWAKIRTQLVAMHAYSGKKLPTFTSNWSSTDSNAVRWAITQYHVLNLPAAGSPVVPSTVGGVVGTPKTPFLSFAQSQAKALKSSGYTSSSSVAPIIPLPATADLNQVTKDAFVKNLGFNPTPAQQASFSKQFQDLVLSYGQAKSNAKAQKAFATPGATSTASHSPIAIEQPPNADVAATNFALKADPNAAGAHGLNEAMGAWFQQLKSGVSNGL